MRVNIMLIGKTGNGKSSTGNSIVGSPVFDEDDGAASATSSVSGFTIKVGDTVVTVVDTPGMRDTRGYDPKREAANAAKYMESSLDYCNGELDLFLLVLQYGSRYTDEEAGAIRDIIRTAYKDEVLDRCMVLFTHGDDFRFKNRGSDAGFRRWCFDQEGQLEELLKSVNYRCCLFDNMRADTYTQQMQRNIVIQEAVANRKKKGSFTKHLFKSLLEKVGNFGSTWCNIL